MSTSHAVSETSFTLKLFVGFLKFKVNWASYSLPGKSDKDLKVEKKFPNCVKLCEFKLRAESGSLTVFHVEFREETKTVGLSRLP